MTKFRKQILLAVLGITLLFYAGDWLLTNLLQGPLQTRRQKTARLQKQIKQREGQLSQARKAAKELKVWQSQSLPSDIHIARSLYQGWLLELVGYVELISPNVDSGEPVGRKGMYQMLSFSVRGRGTLQQLTTFLFEFYSADHLHQIRSLSISPIEKSDLLDLSISIEAMVLTGADRKDRLSMNKSDRLAFGNPDGYRNIIERNLFAVGPGSDEIDHTYLTGINSVDGQPEVWFTVRTADKILKMRKGDTLDVGTFHAIITEIEGIDLILQSGEQRWLLTVGDSLADAFALPPEY